MRYEISLQISLGERGLWVIFLARGSDKPMITTSCTGVGDPPTLLNPLLPGIAWLGDSIRRNTTTLGNR
jgi:hypothetical protein